MYTIDLATILQLLREFRRNGILQAELPAGLPRLKQPCQVVIELVGGEVSSAFVKNTKGQTLLANDEALRAVATLGKLTWVFDQLPALPAASTAPSVPRPPAPPSTPAFPVTSTLQNYPLHGSSTHPLQGSSTHPLQGSSTHPLQGLSTHPLQGSSTQPQMRALPHSPIPRRLLYLSQEEINRWPLRHRQVFVLIDGQRSREKIAAVLALPIPLVAGVLQELQSLGIIEMKPL